jgi:hypothetical protein
MTLSKKLLLLCLFSFTLQATDNFKAIIEDVNDNKATLNIGNLKIGSSGIVIHKFNDDKQIIVANAIVIKSQENKSIIELKAFNALQNDVLANTTLGANKGDIFVGNYLFTKSLIIAPNPQIYTYVKNLFPKIDFISSDIFASSLKLEQNPTPQKKDFQDFCTNNDLGTIYFVIQNQLHVVDARSFQIIETFPIVNTEDEKQAPFYSRIENIEKGLFDWQLSKIQLDANNYEKYYKKLLGLN